MADDTTDALQAGIEAAQEAGETEKAAALYRRQQGTTDPYGLEPGPVPAAEGDSEGDVQPTDADAVDLAAIQRMPSGGMDDYQPWSALTEAEQNDEFESVMSRADPEMARRELGVAWPGGEYDRNVAFVTATAGAVSNTAAALRVLEAVGVADHPELIKWMANVGRLLAVVPGDAATIPTSKSKGKPMTNTMDTKAIEERIDAIEDDIDRAKSRGDYTKANALYAAQQSLYRRLPGGSDPAVGSSGGPTT